MLSLILILKQQFIKHIQMGNTKEINIKNRTYDVFDDMIKIENFNLDKKSYKNIGIYYIRYITIKHSKYVNIHSVNPLYIIIGEVDGSIEEQNLNKYLTFADTNKNKKVLERYKRVLRVLLKK